MTREIFRKVHGAAGWDSGPLKITRIINGGADINVKTGFQRRCAETMILGKIR
jgi:hypothetical protein